MSNEPAATPDAGQPTTEPTEGAPGAQPTEPTTFDAEYVKTLRAESAKYRTEARANAEAAKKLAEYEVAQKTETERAADAKAKAEQERDEARAEALRFRVASRFGISDADAELFLTGTDEESVIRQAERIVAFQKPGTPKPDPTQGATGTSAVGADMNSLIRGGLRRGA